MSWKEEYTGTVGYFELPNIGAFTILDENEPEGLKGGKVRATLTTKDGKTYELTTFPSTIGDIINRGDKDGYVVAFKEKVDDTEYIRFKAAT